MIHHFELMKHRAGIVLVPVLMYHIPEEKYNHNQRENYVQLSPVLFFHLDQHIKSCVEHLQDQDWL